MQINEQDQQTLTRLHGEYLADDKGVRTTSATQLQEDAYALGYKRSGFALAELFRVYDWVKSRNGQPEKLLHTNQTHTMIEKGETLDMLEWALERCVAPISKPITGIHSADPLACSGCVSGCPRCYGAGPKDKARDLLAKVMQNHVTALPLAIRAEIEAVIGVVA